MTYKSYKMIAESILFKNYFTENPTGFSGRLVAACTELSSNEC
jgi:hypothetical protein